MAIFKAKGGRLGYLLGSELHRSEQVSEKGSVFSGRCGSGADAA